MYSTEEFMVHSVSAVPVAEKTLENYDPPPPCSPEGLWSFCWFLLNVVPPNVLVPSKHGSGLHAVLICPEVFCFVQMQFSEFQLCLHDLSSSGSYCDHHGWSSDTVIHHGNDRKQVEFEILLQSQDFYSRTTAATTVD